MQECNQKSWHAFTQFDIVILCSARYSQDVGARVLLKVVTKGSPRGKKTLKI